MMEFLTFSDHEQHEKAVVLDIIKQGTNKVTFPEWLEQHLPPEPPHHSRTSTLNANAPVFCPGQPYQYNSPDVPSLSVPFSSSTLPKPRSVINSTNPAVFNGLYNGIVQDKPLSNPHKQEASLTFGSFDGEIGNVLKKIQNKDISRETEQEELPRTMQSFTKSKPAGTNNKPQSSVPYVHKPAMLVDVSTSSRVNGPLTDSSVQTSLNQQSRTVQTSLMQTPVTQTPVMQLPSTQTYATQTPLAQKSSTQAPVVQQPPTQVPVVQQPPTQVPVTQTHSLQGHVAKPPVLDAHTGQPLKAHNPSVQMVNMQASSVQKSAVQAPNMQKNTAQMSNVQPVPQVQKSALPTVEGQSSTVQPSTEQLSTSQKPVQTSVAQTPTTQGSPCQPTASQPPSVQAVRASAVTPPVSQSPPVNGMSDVHLTKTPNLEEKEQGASSSPSLGSSTKKAWSSLFSDCKPEYKSTPVAVSPEPKANVEENLKQQIKSCNELGALLTQVTIRQTNISLQVRRLINPANWCYINSTLQSLIACPPLYNLLKELPQYQQLSNNRSVTPVLEAMIDFANQFHRMQPIRYDRNSNQKRKKVELNPGEPFEPKDVYNVLNVMKTVNAFQQGRQEDAEEFLSCLLNTLHEEMSAAIKQNDKKENGVNDTASDHTSSDASEESNEWAQIGPRNKAVITHSSVDEMTTPISKIFGGKLRSTLVCGGKESATVEPFFTVPLNVETAKTVEDALKAFVSKEDLEEYTDPSTKQLMEAHRKILFDELPMILILHLKCFGYDKEGGSQKFMHTIRIAEDLQFDRDLMSAQSKSKMSHKQRSYKLFAVTYHSGVKITGGHYHTAVFHTGIKHWIKFDDSFVNQMTPAQVLNTEQPCVPYLLYYRRMDMS